MLLMRWTGPALVGLADMVGIVNGEAGYRPLRDTLPWKFTGFVIGGGVLDLVAELPCRWKMVMAPAWDRHGHCAGDGPFL